MPCRAHSFNQNNRSLLSSAFMPCFRMKRRLFHSKRALRSFASLIKSNLHKLRRSKTIKTAFSVIPRRRNRSAHHLPRQRRRSRAHATRKLNHQLRSFEPVYVDELFQQHAEVKVKSIKQLQHEEAQPDKNLERAYDKNTAATSSSNASDVGEMEEVDLRAEMFIRKFKEKMRLQRQKSFGEYQEMLARGLS